MGEMMVGAAGVAKECGGENEARIGILTFHRAQNYGSALQAYALNRYLRELGFTCETIDYRQSSQEQIYAKYEHVEGVMSLARNLMAYRFREDLDVRRVGFARFLFDCVPQSAPVWSTAELTALADEYDFLLCGSDQVWNERCADFSENYLLSFVKDKRKCVSYAASMGAAVVSSSMAELLAKNVTAFAALSVREASAASALERVVGRRPEVVLDPVFLLDEREWASLAGPLVSEPSYIFAYFIGDVQGMRSFARSLSRQTNLPLVVVNPNLREVVYRNRKLYSAGPLEFLRLIRGAAYVVSNSFHAMAFSSIFEKNFWVFVDDASSLAPSSRIVEFAEHSDLLDRVIRGRAFPARSLSEPEFLSCRDYVARARVASEDFLTRALGRPGRSFPEETR